MAERTLNTRIRLRYASYTEWQNSTVQLLPGEVAVCYVEANNTEIKNTAPTVLFKVGDGSHVFKDLKWSSARAADVFDWAKVEGGQVFTKVGNGNVVSSISWDQSLNENKGGFKYETASVATSEGFEDLQDRVDELERLVAEIIGTTIPALEAEIERVEGLFANYYNKTEIDGKVGALEGQISSAVAPKADKNYVDTELAKKVNVEGYIPFSQEEKDKLAGLSNYDDAKVKEDIEDLKDLVGEGTVDSRIAAAEGRVDNKLANKANSADVYTKEEVYTKNEIESKKYLVAADIASKAEKEYVDEELDKKANSADVYTKEEADSAFMSESEVDARINKIITDAVEGDTLTSLTQLVEYINTHGGEAAEMATAIDALEAKLEGIDSTVVAYVTAAIEALKIGDYAKASDLTALATRVKNLEDNPYQLPSDVVQDANYKHITVTNTSVSDGTNTFTKYDDTALAGRVKANEDAIKEVPGQISSAVASKAEQSYVEEELAKKVNVEGYIPFTSDEKEKLSKLENYDDTALANRVKANEDAISEIPGQISSAVAVEKGRAETAEKALSDRIDAYDEIKDNILLDTDTFIFNCGGAN